MTNTVDLDLPRDEAIIVEGPDDTFACLMFNVSAELLARIALIGGDEAFKCSCHQSTVLNYLLERGTSLKEAELAAEAGQDELF